MTICLDELKARMLNNEESVNGYIEKDRDIAMIELLVQLREHAKISKAELARRLNVTPSSVTQIERNPRSMKLSTLDRYAAACGASINISITIDEPSV